MFELLEINGKKYPVLLNLFVIGCLQQETGHSFDALSELKDKLYLVEPLLWHSLRMGHLMDKKPMEFEREEMPILLSDNELYTRFIELIPKFFPEQKPDKQSGKKK